MRDVFVEIDVITHAVALACLAPSLHNSQPWRWICQGPDVSLFLDDSDGLPYAHPLGWHCFFERLCTTTDFGDVSLSVISERSRDELVRASDLTRSARMFDSKYHAEFIGWTSDVVIAEGIPTTSLHQHLAGRQPIFSRSGRDGLWQARLR